MMPTVPEASTATAGPASQRRRNMYSSMSIDFENMKPYQLVATPDGQCLTKEQYLARGYDPAYFKKGSLRVHENVAAVSARPVSHLSAYTLGLSPAPIREDVAKFQARQAAAIHNTMTGKKNKNAKNTKANKNTKTTITSEKDTEPDKGFGCCFQ